MAIGHRTPFSQTLTLALMAEGADTVVLHIFASSDNTYTKAAGV
jgi:hypothetical protein